MGLTHFYPLYNGFFGLFMNWAFAEISICIAPLADGKLYSNDNLLDRIFGPNRKNRSEISPQAAKSAAKTGQPSNGVFEIEIFVQIPLYTGSRPLRVGSPTLKP